MGQTSGPITGENFTDQTWRDLFGDEPGIVGDVNGTSYRLTLPTASNDAQLGSPSQDSLAVVAGKVHKIPLGETASITIPTSSNTAVGRTDLIVLRFDPALSGDSPLGPVRLYRIAGTEGSASQPSYDGGPPGVEDLPLYAITRKSGQALNQAAVKDLRVRAGRNLLYQPGATFSGATPLGTRIARDGIVWRRDLNPSSSAPEWVRESWFDADGTMVAGKVPRSRQELARSGWLNEYGPNITVPTRRDDTLIQSAVVPPKDFPREVTVEAFLHVDVAPSAKWWFWIEHVATGAAVKPNEGTPLASARLWGEADGQLVDTALTASFTISAGEAKTVRCWLVRTSGDGVTVADGYGYTMNIRWSEISPGNDW